MAARDKVPGREEYRRGSEAEKGAGGCSEGRRGREEAKQRKIQTQGQ